MCRKSNNNKPRQLLLFAVSCLLATCLTALPVAAQILPAPKSSETAEVKWQPPDLANMSVDWWPKLVAQSDEVTTKRTSQLIEAIEQRVRGLDGEELVVAQNSLAFIRSQLELLALARKGPVDQDFEPPLAKESYSLDELLDLRAQWRALAVSTTQLTLQIEQSDRKARLIQDRRDKTLREYAALDPESPARILLGLGRVSARIEYELARKHSQNFKETLKQIESQSRLLVEQQAFARDHLISTDATLADLQKAIDKADANAVASTQKVAALQPQLLNALSADSVNPSLELLRKQQLTRASTEAELAQLQVLLVTRKADWYRFRAGLLETGFDIQARTTQARRATEEALKQVGLWSSISQSTLVTPSSDASLNAVKNLEIAQSVARDTLALVDRIRSSSDELLLIQEILRAEFISSQSGIRNMGARLKFAVGNAWDRLRDLSDFHLFSIGDTPVTPAGIFKMLFILGMALGISWLIRYLLTRGARKKNAAQSPAFYALGRILHYIIVMAGSFAALGSIGIDFTSFALIAGALSVGIGFGLQAIVSNFVSGLILLFEGTLRVGDFIELEGGSTGAGFRGVVKEINTRATVITTNDSVDLVVPNSVLVTTQLTNWTLRESYGRLRVPFGVAYGTDKELVKKVALEAIGHVESALTHMPGREPQIRLTNFGDSSLDYTALFWVSRQGVRRPGRTRAEFLWELETRLGENGIVIPFPQRDVHVVSDFRARQHDGLEPETSES